MRFGVSLLPEGPDLPVTFPFRFLHYRIYSATIIVDTFAAEKPAAEETAT